MKLDTSCLRRATDDDDSLLRELFAADRAPVLIDVQYAGRRTSWAVQWPHAEDFVIEVDAEPVGRVLVNRGEQVWWVVDIAVIPGRRGQGIATRVLRDLIDLAHRRGVALGLRVDRDNPATRLYAQLGLRVVGEDDLRLVMQTDPTEETP